jgi:OOP family OmpA-OmpF porin
VIRGTPPETLHLTLRDTLAIIHDEWGDALAAFAGDDAAFAGTDDRLRACLQEQAQVRERRISPLLWLLPLLLVALVGYSLYHRHADRRRFDRPRQAPGVEPGSSSPGPGGAPVSGQVIGMRDPCRPIRQRC